MLAILATHAIKLDSAAVANLLGPDCTSRAVEERLKKLKKMAKERGLEMGSDATTTPKKNGKGEASSPPALNTPTPKKRKTKAAAVKKEATSAKAEPKDEHQMVLGRQLEEDGDSEDSEGGGRVKRSREDFEGFEVYNEVKPSNGVA